MHHGFHTDLLPPPPIAPPKIQLERERERRQQKLGKPVANQSLKQRKGNYNNKQSALARMGCCGSTEETNFWSLCWTNRKRNTNRSCD
jgi:hypothetical protein